MIFVDTNIFLRFLLHDNEKQYRQTKQLFIQAAKPEIKLLTSTIVFFEVAWILTKSFKDNKPRLVRTLFEIMDLNLELEQRSLVIDSLLLFQNSALRLVDCFNLLYANKKAVEGFKTFDEKLKREFEKLNRG